MQAPLTGPCTPYNPWMSYYKHHIFFCLNQRDNNEAACAQHDSQGAFEHCKAAVKRAGFADALHLQGGILAWAAQLEPDMVMY